MNVGKYFVIQHYIYDRNFYFIVSHFTSQKYGLHDSNPLGFIKNTESSHGCECGKRVANRNPLGYSAKALLESANRLLRCSKNIGKSAEVAPFTCEGYRKKRLDEKIRGHGVKFQEVPSERHFDEEKQIYVYVL